MDEGIENIVNLPDATSRQTVTQWMNRSHAAAVLPSEDGEDEDVDDGECSGCNEDGGGIEQADSGYSSVRAQGPVPPRMRPTPAQSVVSYVTKKKTSYEEELKQKQEILYKLDRIEKRGARLPRRFTVNDALPDMRAELQRLTRDVEMDRSVAFQRSLLVSFVTGVEFLNNQFDPFNVQLTGWSEQVHENISQYDEVFEELHDKYQTKMKVPPEVRLLMMLVSSGFMFHMTKSMFKNIPGAEQILKANPGLARDFAAATAKTMGQEAQRTGDSAAGGLSGLLGGLFGGGGGGLASAVAPPRGPTGEQARAPPPPIRPPQVADDEAFELFSEFSSDGTVRDALQRTAAGAGAPSPPASVDGGTLILDI